MSRNLQGEILIAHKFAFTYRNQVRYCKADKQWFIWDGKRYAPDHTNQIIELGKGIILALYTEAGETTNDAARKELWSAAAKHDKAKAIRDMIFLAGSDPRLAITAKELDRDPFLLNCQNGTFDLRTMTLRPHDPKDLITRITAVDYDPTAPRDQWVDFLTKIMLGREDLVDYLQQICGLSLIGRCLEHKVFILYGSGRNGKTTFLGVYSTVLGPDYASSVPLRAILAGSHDEHPTALASFKGLRFMYAVEPKKNAKFDDGAVKAISGGDDQQSRKMRKDYTGGRIDGTLLLALNNPPSTTDNSVAMRERLRLIPFEFHVDPDKRDNLIDQKLLAQGPGILAWAIEGLRKWKESGNRFASEPEAVMTKVEEFWQGQDPDHATLAALPIFVEETFIPVDSEHPPVGTSESFILHNAWCEVSNLKPLGKTTFYEAMDKLGHKRDRQGRTGPMVWLDLAQLNTK